MKSLAVNLYMDLSNYHLIFTFHVKKVMNSTQIHHDIGKQYIKEMQTGKLYLLVITPNPTKTLDMEKHATKESFRTIILSWMSKEC